MTETGGRVSSWIQTVDPAFSHCETQFFTFKLDNILSHREEWQTRLVSIRNEMTCWIIS
jgi:hypothetical protein